MGKRIIVIGMVLLLIFSSFVPISIGYKVNISENIEDNFSSGLDSGGGSTLLNKNHPEGTFVVLGHDPDGSVIKYFIDYDDGFFDESVWVMNGTEYWINHTFPINIIDVYEV